MHVQQAPARGAPLRRLGPALLLALAWLAVVLRLARRQLTALAVHDLQWAQDLAFFNQILFNASEGRAWTSPLLIEPVGFFEMVHFHPVFAAILPVYVAAPGPGTLLVINVLAVTAAAFPLARLGAASSGSPWFGLAAGLAFLLWLPTESAAGADFRPMVFWIPGLAWLLHGAYAGRWGALLGGAALVCAAREESAYVLPALGAVLLVLPFGGRRWRQGLALIAVGLAWFGFLLAFKENFFFHFDPTRPPVGEPPAPELLQARLAWLARSLGGSYLLAPLSPAPLAMSGAPLAWLMPDQLREWQLATGPYVHLRSALLPLFAGAGTVGAGWLVRRWPRALWPLALWLVLGNLLLHRDDRAALEARAQSHRDQLGTPELLAIDALLAQVPPEARVATDYDLIAALSGRRSLWNIRHLYMQDGEPPYWTAEWPLTLDRVDTLVAPMDEPIVRELDEHWVLERQGANYGLWRRSAPPAGGYPAPIP
ncbi:MAG: DUF2079 domain-containing protein [Alphaproteobacteria bacterium]|nr:DUF2079 domain-containing protein [Alphaproteobacteria bacterium]